jgi:ParB-like chromosome segregation protein Spo0J
MNAMQINFAGPQTPLREERIGDYQVHPIASMFPLMQGEEFEKFKISIQDRGQLEPIIVQGNKLLDGRNRLRACLELGIEPNIREFGEADSGTVGRYILAINLDRRHLSMAKRIEISNEANGWMVRERNRLRKLEGQRSGGRGHKKNLTMNSGSSLSEPKSRARHERSTLAEIAKDAKTTPHQAAQVLRVLEHGTPELKQQLREEKITPREAVKQLPPPASPKPKTKPTPPPQLTLPNFDQDIAHVLETLRKLIDPYSTTQKTEFIHHLIKEIRRQWPN